MPDAPESPSEPAVRGEAQLTAGKLQNFDRVLVAARPRVRRCYRDGLKARPGLEGTVRYTLPIESDGAVGSVSVSSDGDLSPEVLRCTKAALAGLRFEPPASKAATVTGSLLYLNPTKGK